MSGENGLDAAIEQFGFPAIPESWAWTRIGDVGEVRLGRQRSPKNRSADYPTKYLRAANITWDGIDLEDVLEMDFKPAERETYQLCPGDVLLSEASGSADEVGKPAVWNGDDGECYCFQNTVIRFRPSESVAPRYAHAIFSHFARNGVFPRVAKGVGIHHLSASRFSKIPFPVPPPNEQRRIVAKIEELFSDLDAGVAALERARANLKRYRAAVLKAAVEGRLTADWRAEHPDAEPATTLLDRLLTERRQRWEAAQDEKGETSRGRAARNKYAAPETKLPDGLPELPASWCWTTLDSLTHYTVDYRGKTPPTADSGIPIISAANVKAGRVVHDKPKYVTRETYEEWTTRGLPRPGDLIVTTEAPVAETALYPAEGEFLLTRRVFACQTAEVDSRFVMHAFSGSAAKEHIKLHLRGTTVPRILKPDLLSVAIPLPPVDEQRAIADTIDALLSVDSAIGHTLTTGERRAARLRQSILKRAFEGRLVPQDPTDEPASTLLARIAAEREQAKENGKPKRRRRSAE